MPRDTERDDRAELVAIMQEGSSLSRNEADHIAGMMIGAGFNRPARKASERP